MDILTNYHVLKVLGQGSEGTVYLVEEKEGFRKLVLKVFHEPHTRDWFSGLAAYADRICPNEYGLPHITLLFRHDNIVGLVYPYVQLSSVHWRILDSYETVAQSVVGSYCKKQYYLMSEYGLALYDPVIQNLMVDKNGLWHYLDIGGGICLLDDPWIREHGAIGYGFASMIMSIYRKTLHHYMNQTEIYSYDGPCIYCKNEWLDAVGLEHRWVREIEADIQSHKSSVFYDPEFYRRLGDRLPERVPWPSVILPFSKTLSGLGELRGGIGL